MWQSVSDYKAAQPKTATPAPAATPTTPADTAPPPSATPAAHPAPVSAVQRCCSAYKNAFTITRDTDKANDAFKNALPFLTNRATIFDFMACVTHGILIKVFWNNEGPRLISAAKATLAALPREPAARGPGRPTKSQQASVPEN